MYDANEGAPKNKTALVFGLTGSLNFGVLAVREKECNALHSGNYKSGSNKLITSDPNIMYARANNCSDDNKIYTAHVIIQRIIIL